MVIVPLYDDRRLRYQDWVAGRRQVVRARSDGRVGYLHVPDMMGEGGAHLHRDLRAEMGRDALIVDVRGNRGGHTSQLIVEKLARRIPAGRSRGRLRPYSYPHEAPRGPLVALTDEFAGSDGDIVTAAIRSLGLGPVIGARTWGGVVGIDGTATTWWTAPGHRPALRVLVQRVRLVGGELRRRPGHRGPDHPRRLGHRPRPATRGGGRPRPGDAGENPGPAARPGHRPGQAPPAPPAPPVTRRAGAPAHIHHDHGNFFSEENTYNVLFFRDHALRRLLPPQLSSKGSKGL